MNNTRLVIVLALLCVVAAVVIWQIAGLHRIRTGEVDYSFQLEPDKKITQEIKPQVGDVILLQGNQMSSAGYKWIQENLPSRGVYRVIDSVTESGSNPTAIGGASKASIRLEVIGEGEATAQFKHMRSFGEQDTTGTFSLVFK